ncbi:hypothetical protein [Streptomyces sp. SID12488]|uniref:hypothetical protein n=1 Tax=Streptomyces sp. SID12488 TaxID=2706040 RepID=UPI0013DD4098|nr:hypothetical protein [Streptomyces sp. SID12488]NEA68977.1 hypothetical protein [Streptomyces sp. SID12488]
MSDVDSGTTAFPGRRCPYGATELSEEGCGGLLICAVNVHSVVLREVLDEHDGDTVVDDVRA